MQENPLAAGLGLPREPPPLSLVIFGASGDLTRRKLIPALFSLLPARAALARMRIVGLRAAGLDDGGVPRAGARDARRGGVPRGADRALKDAFAARVGVRPLRVRRSRRATRRCGDGSPTRPTACSTSPPRPTPTSASWSASARRGSRTSPRGFSRIIVEKPLGRDLDSARALNERIAAAFPEEQIYRIDHYLGKETVQNIMLLRFGNGIFEPVWNNRYVDHVQITMAETIGVEARGRLLRGGGRAARHDAEPHAAAPVPRGHGAARWTCDPTASATRR